MEHNICLLHSTGCWRSSTLGLGLIWDIHVSGWTSIVQWLFGHKNQSTGFSLDTDGDVWHSPVAALSEHCGGVFPLHQPARLGVHQQLVMMGAVTKMLSQVNFGPSPEQVQPCKTGAGSVTQRSSIWLCTAKSADGKPSTLVSEVKTFYDFYDQGNFIVVVKKLDEIPRWLIF